MNDRDELDLDALAREAAALRAEYQRLLDSGRYRLGRLLLEAAASPRALLRLPWRLYRLVRELRRRRRVPGPGSPAYETVVADWQRLVARTREGGQGPLVFLFSGTTHVQDTRGNRPIRLALALLERGLPVLFNYHRWRLDEPLPPVQHPALVQSPVDISMQLLDEFARADLGAVPRLLVVAYPYPGIERWVGTFRQQGWRVVYDCRDDWAAFARVGMARWFDAAVERQLVQHSDEVFCVSGTLVEKMQRLAPDARVTLLPNALDSAFVPVGYRRAPATSPRIVGYFGHLASAWFDWEALTQVARARPQYRFELVGHSAPAALQLPQNVVLVGARPWHALPALAARWSCAIIPFRMGELADGVDPIKIYEYLALGLPVVSFYMPQIRDYPGTEVVSGVDAFCAALDRACVRELDAAATAAFLAGNTWQQRADRLLAATHRQVGDA